MTSLGWPGWTYFKVSMIKRKTFLCPRLHFFRRLRIWKKTELPSSSKVNRGHRRSKIETFQNRSNDLSNGRKLHGESNAIIFSTTRGHPRSPGVTKGQKSKIFNICQMTYQMEGNFTGNLIQPFLAPFEVTQGHQGSPKVKNRKFSVGPVHQDQTGPKGH